MKKGLVLEGGAMRGMFTAGVLDVFMEHGVVVEQGPAKEIFTAPREERTRAFLRLVEDK